MDLVPKLRCGIKLKAEPAKFLDPISLFAGDRYPVISYPSIENLSGRQEIRLAVAFNAEGLFLLAEWDEANNCDATEERVFSYHPFPRCKIFLHIPPVLAADLVKCRGDLAETAHLYRLHEFRKHIAAGKSHLLQFGQSGG